MKNEERDAAICACYLDQGAVACEKKFHLKRQRIYQILKKGGVRQPKSTRTKFLGVTVSEGTKTALKERADKEGVSVSKLTSDALDALVTK